MAVSKKPKTKRNDVRRFLESTGFIFEMQVASKLKEWGYTVFPNRTFIDLDGNKKREIDIIAGKIIGEVALYLVIECKQSLEDDWVFVCTNTHQNKGRWTIKHWPSADYLKIDSLFAEHYAKQAKVLTAQNYLSFDRSKGKKKDAEQIEQCLQKLPKAVIDLAVSTASDSTTKRKIFIPVALFSGQLFEASYTSSLSVNIPTFVQYAVEFSSPNYHSSYRSNLPGMPGKSVANNQDTMVDETLFELFGPDRTDYQKCNTTMSKYYLVDFVAFNKLKKYLGQLEHWTMQLNIENWPIPEKDKAKGATG